MSKEMLEDLIIEFGEMGFEPSTLCPDIEEEINSFRRRLKQILKELEELDKFKALLNKYEIKDIEALEALIKDYDGMAKAFVQHVLGIEIEVQS
jgi:hypothetical protein